MSIKKEELVRWTRGLRDESLLADAYYSLLCQHRINKVTYGKEYQTSASFYDLTEEALSDAFFMVMARLYDGHDGTINLESWLKACRQTLPTFPSNLSYPVIRQHNEWFVLQEGQTVQDIDGQTRRLEPDTDVSIESGGNIGVILDVYLANLKGLSKSIGTLRERRNRVYAHNAADVCFNRKSVAQQYSLGHTEISCLLDFAMSSTRYVMLALTGSCKPKRQIRIGDWLYTLDSVRFAEDCRQLIAERTAEKEDGVVSDVSDTEVQVTEDGSETVDSPGE